MPLDQIYLQSIKELEEENNVEFPKELVLAFAEKKFTCEYDIYSDQVYHGAHSIEESSWFYRYNFFRNYYNSKLNGLETTKKELYKKSIPLPQKAFITLNVEYDEPTELYVRLNKDGDYWCWEMGSNRGYFSPILCLYNVNRTRFFDAWYGTGEKDENDMVCDYVLNGDEISFDLTLRDNNKLLWEDDEKINHLKVSRR